MITSCPVDKVKINLLDNLRRKDLLVFFSGEFVVFLALVQSHERKAFEAKIKENSYVSRYFSSALPE